MAGLPWDLQLTKQPGFEHGSDSTDNKKDNAHAQASF